MLPLRCLLILCMFTQPFCRHCFAEMRTPGSRVEIFATDKENATFDDLLESDVVFPLEDKGICTKKSGLSSPQNGPDTFKTTLCLGKVSAETAFSPSVFPDTKTFLDGATDCPAWLRLSVLLI